MAIRKRENSKNILLRLGAVWAIFGAVAVVVLALTAGPVSAGPGDSREPHAGTGQPKLYPLWTVDRAPSEHSDGQRCLNQPEA